jgi:hypothetical protein
MDCTARVSVFEGAAGARQQSHVTAWGMTDTRDCHELLPRQKVLSRHKIRSWHKLSYLWDGLERLLGYEFFRQLLAV